MNRVILHCGAAKTGTSYLQVLFARHADALDRAGIVYPPDPTSAAAMDMARAGAVTSGNGVGLANFLRPDLPHAIADKSAFAGHLKSLLAQHQGKDLLFSSEFIVFPEGDETRILFDTITQAGYRPLILYMVRDIASAARATYSQQVKRHGETRRFADYLSDWSPHYLHHIRLMQAAAGPENVAVYNYDEQRARLAEFMFADVLGAAVPEETTFVTNRSLTARETELMRVMNGHFPPGQTALSTLVSDALISVAKERDEIGLTPEEHDVLHQRFAQTVTFVNTRIRGREIAISPHTPEKRHDIQLSETETALAAVLARLTTRIFENG